MANVPSVFACFPTNAMARLGEQVCVLRVLCVLTCVLCLQVHWLRIIVDEGHSLGASLALTNKLAMAVELAAQRRWVMTGTPTPSTSSGAKSRQAPQL